MTNANNPSLRDKPLLSKEQFDDFLSQAKSGEVDDKAIKNLITDLSEHYKKSLSLIGSETSGLSTDDLKEMKKLAFRLRRYISRLLRQYILRQLKKHSSSGKRQKFIISAENRNHVNKITRGTIPEGQLLQAMLKASSYYDRQKISNNPVNKLKELLKNEEGCSVEAKASLSLYQAIGKTICAFANTSGGTLVIGITELNKLGASDDDFVINDLFVVRGLTDDIDSQRIQLTQFLGNKLTISLSLLSFEVISAKGRKIMLIKVPKVRKIQHLPTFYDGDLYIREDNHNKKLSSREVYGMTKSDTK